MNFVKHFIGDYSRSTGDLSITEHGAYRLMLDHFYGSGKPLPSDKKALYRLLRAENDSDKRAIDTVALRFWKPLPEGLETIYEWVNLRLDEDKDRYNRVAAGWTDCGLINIRALSEILKAEAMGERNRKIAVEREARRRAVACTGGAK